MKIYKVTISIIDFDGLGPEEIKDTIEQTKYPNRCISPDVVDIQEKDIGEWDDDHPLNDTETFITEFNRLFP